MTFYMNSRQWSAWTQVLAGSTAYAAFFIHSWNPWTELVVGILWHHGDGSNWTVTGTVTTLSAIGDDDTVVWLPNSMANLNGRLLFLGNRLNGTGRTNL